MDCLETSFTLLGRLSVPEAFESLIEWLLVRISGENVLQKWHLHLIHTRLLIMVSTLVLVEHGECVARWGHVQGTYCNVVELALYTAVYTV